MTAWSRFEAARALDEQACLVAGMHVDSPAHVCPEVDVVRFPMNERDREILDAYEAGEDRP